MTLQARLSTLESSGLVQVAADYPELEYLFRHTLIQEAAYESMLKQDRKQLHLAVGEALERAYPDRLEESDGLLAYHYSRAEVWDRTFAHAWAAARRAKRLYASAEALAYYDLALTALSQLNAARSKKHWPLNGGWATNAARPTASTFSPGCTVDWARLKKGWRRMQKAEA
ncbi:MAG: hypothetical protein AAB382_02440 [Chloroflexota bacterium]